MGKVLIVDDEANIRTVVRRLLERAGHEVVAAADGPEGYLMALAESPDLALLDITMPGMSGFMVLHKLKANPVTAPIPVIILTSSMHPRDVRVGREEGAIDYILKPWDRGVLEARVNNALAYRQARQSSLLEAPVKHFVGDYFAIPEEELEDRIQNLTFTIVEEHHRAAGRRDYQIEGSAHVTLEASKAPDGEPRSFNLHLALSGDGAVLGRQGSMH